MRRRRALPVAVALAVAGVLSGCAGQVTAADLAGTYRDDDGLRPLILRSDGTCTAHLLRTGSTDVTGTCRWALRQHDGPQVRLDFHRDPSAGAYFVDYQVDGTGSAAMLFQTTDPDQQQRYELHR